jgi:hypothetical protein
MYIKTLPGEKKTGSVFFHDGGKKNLLQLQCKYTPLIQKNAAKSEENIVVFCRVNFFISEIKARFDKSTKFIKKIARKCIETI